MRVYDRQNQPREALLDLRARGGCVHPPAAPLPPDHPRLSQCPEVLRERGLRNCLIANVQKHGAVMRALLSHYVCIDRHPDRVGQGMEDSLYRDVLKRWME